VTGFVPLMTTAIESSRSDGNTSLCSYPRTETQDLPGGFLAQPVHFMIPSYSSQRLTNNQL
jgi:hypothetical protein